MIQQAGEYTLHLGTLSLAPSNGASPKHCQEWAPIRQRARSRSWALLGMVPLNKHNIHIRIWIAVTEMDLGICEIKTALAGKLKHRKYKWCSISLITKVTGLRSRSTTGTFSDCWSHGCFSLKSSSVLSGSITTTARSGHLSHNSFLTTEPAGQYWFQEKRSGRLWVSSETSLGQQMMVKGRDTKNPEKKRLKQTVVLAEA